ncbi:ABC transporter permease [Nocardioides sp.]|uniref:ABC transporter permease n=1 Tax=Nocardioides sp. TaxID=35761 RepID=UPI0039E69050
MSSVLERPARAPADAPPSRVRKVLANKRMLVVTTVLAVLLVYGMITTDGFATLDNGRAILAAVAITGFGALGATIVMLGGNLFSMSASVTAAGAAMVFLAALDYGVVVALVVALLAGAGAYALQGFAIGAWGANPIVVTIGAGSLQAAVATMITNGSSVRVAPEVTSYKFLADTVFGIPAGVYLLAASAVVLHALLTRTVWGRTLYFLGKSPPAAYAAGLPVVLTTVIAFAIAGACTGFAGVVQAASTQSATVNDLATLTFDAIAAAVVGGNAIAGGRGSIPRTLLGVLVIATLSDLLLLRDYSAGVRLLATGLLVIVFVFATSSKEQAR